MNEPSGASSGPRAAEHTFNIALGNALRRRRVNWRDDEHAIIVERTGTISGSPSDRPDILVEPDNSNPVVIETEIATDPTNDAKARLGAKTEGENRDIYSAIGVRVPEAVRAWPDQEFNRRLAPTGVHGQPFTMEYAAFSLGRNSDIDRWPADGWIEGTVSDLADLCEAVATPQHIMADLAQEVADQIRSIAHGMHRRFPKHSTRAICDSIGQKDPHQGLRLACCIWMATLRICDMLSRQDELKKLGLLSITELQARSASGERVLLPDVWEQWRLVLGYNYRSVVAPAVQALVNSTPLDIGSEYMGQLAKLAQKVNANSLGDHIDFTGQLFPEMLADRKQTAAFYTLPDLATILANVAVDALPVDDWSDIRRVSCLRIADFACGTGTLLRSAYRKVLRNYQDAGGSDIAAVHLNMMEGSITGTDINALAAHMTAAALSTVHIEQLYESTNVGAVQVQNGKTGALEFLEHQQVPTITGAATKSERISRTELEQIHATDGEYSLVIQNPPYTRGRGGANLFDVAGITERQRKRSVARLQKLRAGAKHGVGSGTAGLASDFSELAFQKLGEGGIFASVLPLTAAKAISWAPFRSRMLINFAKVIAIAFPAFSKQAVSADTGMKEFLIVGIDYDPMQVIKDDAELICVNFHSRPGATHDAIEFARQVSRLSNETDVTEGRIATYAGAVGEWCRYTINDPNAPWFGVGCRSNTVAAAAIGFMDGTFRHVRRNLDQPFAIPTATVGEVCTVGPTHHLIGHLRGKHPIGAFVFDRIQPGTVPDYPSLWAANTRAQKHLVVEPTHTGWAHDAERTHRRWETASKLAVSRNLDMTSQQLAAAWLDEPAMGGSTWTTLQHQDESVLRAMLIWLNSTPGLIVRWAHGQTTQHGRARLQIGDIADMPVPDFGAESESAADARDVADAEFANLCKLKLKQVALAAPDENRHKIDDVALRMLGTHDIAVLDALHNIRRQWCAEPSVNGLRTSLLKRLGISLDT